MLNYLRDLTFGGLRCICHQCSNSYVKTYMLLPSNGPMTLLVKIMVIMTAIILKINAVLSDDDDDDDDDNNNKDND